MSVGLCRFMYAYAPRRTFTSIHLKFSLFNLCKKYERLIVNREKSPPSEDSGFHYQSFTLYRAYFDCVIISADCLPHQSAIRSTVFDKTAAVFPPLANSFEFRQTLHFE